MLFDEVNALKRGTGEMGTKRPNAARATRANTSAATKGCGWTAVAAAVLGGLLGLQPAFAQDSGSVTVDVGPCVELESAAERLACFDARSGAVLETRGSAGPGAADTSVEAGGDSSAAETAVTIPQRAPGRGGRPATDDSSHESSASETNENEFRATITGMSERQPQTFVITLDNGQVWQQTAPKRYPLRPGLEVRIYESKWGDYRLSGAGAGSFIRVRRIR